MSKIKIDVNNLDKYFEKDELIPAIAFDINTKTVLMLAYMNRESLKKTLETGYTWYWSRSRGELWNKGSTSGHLQKVVSIYSDCDNDTLLLNVEQTGVACHTGSYSCFFNEMYNSEENKKGQKTMTVYQEIFEVIKQRKTDYEKGIAQENSYTAYLFDKGVDKICKKVGEEATETVIAAKNGNNEELMNEINDLLYHVMVLAANQGLDWSDVEKVLEERNEKIGNLKQFHQVDKNS